MTRKTTLKIILPILVLGLGVVGFVGLVKSRKAPPRVERPVLGPLVRTAPVEVRDVTITVSGNGTVRPRTEVALSAEVGGRIVDVSPSLVSGGFFAAGDLLLRIDPRDYELAVSKAEAEVARAVFELAREKEESEIARREWELVGKDATAPSPSGDSLLFRGPQLRLARANVDAARARLDEARLALSRTRITAPFDGRVKSESVGEGQYVTPGAAIATIYATDRAEVAVPIPDEDLAWFRVPLAPGDGDGTGSRAAVVARFSGTTHKWRGRVVRSEGSIDPASRLVNVVVEVRHPFEPERHPKSTVPLVPGLFVECRIAGTMLPDAAVVPRSALRDGDTVWVAGDDGRLHMTSVDVARRDRETVYLRDGLREGQHVILSRIDAVTDGMKIRTTDEKPQRSPAEPAEATAAGEASPPAPQKGI